MKFCWIQSLSAADVGKIVEWGELGGRAKLLYGHECFYLSQLEFGRMVCSPLVDSLKLDSKTYFSTIL